MIMGVFLFYRVKINNMKFIKSILENPLWQEELLGNSLGDYTTTVIIFIVFLVIFKIFQAIIVRYLKKLSKKTKTDIDDTLVEIVNSINPPFYSFLAFYFALQFVNINATALKVISTILIVWIVYLIIRSFKILIDYITNKLTSTEKGVGRTSAIKILGKIAQGVLWALGILIILSNLGIDITSLIAGLGIGGIAVALALQNILMDLFSSFAIYFDKPFVVGDFIITGDQLGVVEKIGIKTTRLRALQGEEIIISNQELTSARIQNFKKMKKRRVVFSFGVTYETSNEKLERIPEIVKNIVDSVQEANLDRVHFNKFDNSALNFEVVYYVNSSEYNIYMDINQKILFGIKAKFEEQEISMAYPTQTLYIAKD